MNVTSLSVGPIGTNCYIVQVNQEALIIDPGGEAEKIISLIEKEGLFVKAILLTHAHFDHIGALEEIRRHFAVGVYIHEEESDWLLDPNLNRSRFFTGDEVITTKAEHLLYPGELQIGSFSFEVVHTPGHSPGSVSFIFNDDGFVISGDVLFRHGIGRTDLPGGNMKVLEASIRNKLYRLDNNMIVYPGHGPETTIGEEKLTNPFFSE